jgi:hypothetical protein
VSKFTAAIATGLAIFATPAFAQNVSVDMPDILKGRFEVETDSVYVHDVVGEDDVFAHQLVVAYSITDNIRVGGGVIVNDLIGSGPRADAYLAEVRFEGPRPSWMPFEWGLIGTYIGGGPEGINDAFALRAIAAGDVGPITVVANVDALRETGGGASEDTSFGLTLEGQLPITESFIAAITYAGDLGTDDDFGDLGTRGQYIGPTVYAAMPVGGASALGVEAGVLFGITDESADAIGKVNLTWATQF